MRIYNLKYFIILFITFISTYLNAQNDLSLYLDARYEYLGEVNVKNQTTRNPTTWPKQNRTEFGATKTKYRFLILLNIQVSGRPLLPKDYLVLKYKYFDGTESEISFGLEDLIQIGPDQYEYSFQVSKEFEGTMEMYLQHKNRFSKKGKIKSESNKISLYLSR